MPNLTTLLSEKVRAVVEDLARVRLPDLRTPVLLLGVPKWSEVADITSGLKQMGVSTQEDNISVRKNASERGDFVARVNLPYRDAIKLTEGRFV